jgi:hypothetical protein
MNEKTSNGSSKPQALTPMNDGYSVLKKGFQPQAGQPKMEAVPIKVQGGYQPSTSQGTSGPTGGSSGQTPTGGSSGQKK